VCVYNNNYQLRIFLVPKLQLGNAYRANNNKIEPIRLQYSFHSWSYGTRLKTNKPNERRNKNAKNN